MRLTTILITSVLSLLLLTACPRKPITDKTTSPTTPTPVFSPSLQPLQIGFLDREVMPKVGQGEDGTYLQLPEDYEQKKKRLVFSVVTLSPPGSILMGKK